MPYTPSFNDIPDTAAAPLNSSGGYSPSLQDIHEAEAPVSAMSQQTGDTLLNNPLTNYYKGFAHAIGSLGTDIANLIPGVNVKMPELGSGTAYNLGNIGGNIGTFLAGGEGLDAVRAALAAKDIPAISSAANLLGGEGISGIARRAIGTAGYGAVTNPNDPLKGGLEGTAASLIGDAIPGAAGLIGKGINAIQPQKLSDQIVGALGGGKSLEENAQSIAQDIKSSYRNRQDEATNLYDQATSNFGDKNIYPASPQGTTLGLFQQLNGAYPGVTKNLSDNFSNDLQDLHNNFLNDPTFNNAHELRKQLNSEISQYYKPGVALKPEDQNSLSALQQSKTALDQDINSFMQTQPSNIANQYQEANNYFAQNVAPYRDNRQIFKIAQGDITNPKNLVSILKSPEPEVQKVVNDLPNDAKNRVVYSMLGKTNATASPENLVKAFNDLDQQGLGSYVSPSLADQIQKLSTQIKARNIAQGVAGGALASTFLPHFFSPEIVGMGTLGAGYLGPMIARAGQRMMPDIQFLPALTNALRNSYGAARTAIIPNIVGGQQ